MQMVMLEGTLIKDPEYRNGVSKGGFEWESVDLYVDELGVEKASVFKCGGFGKIASRVRDYNLLSGSIVSLVLKVESRGGSGEYAGKYFTSLSIESFEYNGVNDGDVGVVDSGVVSSGVIEEDFEVGDISGDLPF